MAIRLVLSRLTLTSFTLLAAIGISAAIAQPGSKAAAKAATKTAAISFKTKLIEISVTLGDTIASNDALSKNLIAEGKTWADKNRASAVKESKQMPMAFRNGVPWSFERDYAALSVVAERYISVLRTDFVYTGGAHPNTMMQTILWDTTANKRISIRPFFKDTADNSATLIALRDAILVALRKEKKQRGIEDDGDEWFKDVKPTLLALGPVTLTPSTTPDKSAGLTFHYEPYAVGPYAEGRFEAFVPWDIFAAHLTPEGVAIFSGKPVAETKSDK